LIEVFQLGLFCLQKSSPKRQKLIPIHRAIDVVGVALVVSTCTKGLSHIDTFTFNDGTRRIEKMAIVSPSKGA